jgi:arsenite methyltransferase
MQKEILKREIKKNYAKIALEGNISNTCSSSTQDICCDTNNNNSNLQITSNIGYNEIDLKTIPQESILGLGCGAPLNFADLKTGETLVDLGSGAGIDAFLASELVGDE